MLTRAVAAVSAKAARPAPTNPRRRKSPRGTRGSAAWRSYEYEGPEERDGEAERHQRGRRAKARLFDPREPQDQEHQPCGDCSGSEEVHPVTGREVLARGEKHVREYDPRCAHGDVEEEDPLPAQGIRDETAQKQARRSPWESAIPVRLRRLRSTGS